MKARLTSPDRALWPQAGLTKRDLWDYMEAVADRLLPHIADRPLTMKRFPRGVDADGFFQKDLGDGAPDWLGRHREWTPSSKRFVDYAVARSVDDLRWLANQSAIELHAMLVRANRMDRPDTMVFDIDPAEGSIGAAPATLWLKEILDDLGLRARVKTSGKRGIHVYVPLERRYAHPEIRGLGHAISACCAAAHPDALTAEMRKEARGGRLLMDWSRNGPAQTSVAPWSPRATPEATVSMPLDWSEVTEDLDPDAFTIRTALDRPDAWSENEDCPPQRIERARERLQSAGWDCEDRDPRGFAGR